MPKISLLIHTASPDSFLIGQGIPSAVTQLIVNLNAQTFTDFELVYTDFYYETNKEFISQLKPNFKLKHVPLHPKLRYHRDQNYFHISAAKNTGLLHASKDTVLCISCDDAELFPPYFLEKYWHYWTTEKRYLLPFHKRFKSINPTTLEGDMYINDSRWETARTQPYRHDIGAWAWAGTSFTLEHALELNFYNLKFDGNKSLEDCEWGTRLELTGGKFVMDREVFIAILDHPSYTEASGIKEFVAVENYGMCRWVRELNELVANIPMTLNEHHKRLIREATLKHRFFDPFAPENKEKLNFWLNTPTFDFRKERKLLAEAENNV